MSSPMHLARPSVEHVTVIISRSFPSVLGFGWTRTLGTLKHIPARWRTLNLISSRAVGERDGASRLTSLLLAVGGFHHHHHHSSGSQPPPPLPSAHNAPAQTREPWDLGRRRLSLAGNASSPPQQFGGGELPYALTVITSRISYITQLPMIPLLLHQHSGETCLPRPRRNKLVTPP